MKKLFLFIFIVIFFISFFCHDSYTQTDSCGTVPFVGETSSPSTFIGGRYKPHRTDIGGSPSAQELDYFSNSGFIYSISG